MVPGEERMEYRFNDGGRSAAGYRGETRDCAARAIAIACGMDYATAYVLVNGYARKSANRRRSNARTGVQRDVMHSLLGARGWRYVSCMGIGTGCKVHLRDGEIPMTGPVICNVSKHYVAVIDGVIYDTHNPARDGTRCVYGYWVPA